MIDFGEMSYYPVLFLHLGYVETLMELLFNNVVKDPGAYQDFLDTVLVPEKLCSQYTRPDKREAVARHKSRFFKNM